MTLALRHTISLTIRQLLALWRQPWFVAITVAGMSIPFDESSCKERILLRKSARMAIRRVKSGFMPTSRPVRPQHQAAPLEPDLVGQVFERVPRLSEDDELASQIRGAVDDQRIIENTFELAPFRILPGGPQ